MHPRICNAINDKTPGGIMSRPKLGKLEKKVKRNYVMHKGGTRF